jgi:hypothetical protein
MSVNITAAATNSIAKPSGVSATFLVRDFDNDLLAEIVANANARNIYVDWPEPAPYVYYDNTVSDDIDDLYDFDVTVTFPDAALTDAQARDFLGSLPAADYESSLTTSDTPGLFDYRFNGDYGPEIVSDYCELYETLTGRPYPLS